MKKFKVPLLIAALAVGTTGILTVPRLLTTVSYDALTFTENASKSVSIAIDETVDIILPADFDPDNSTFETESEGVTLLGTLDIDTMQITLTGVKAGIDRLNITDGNYTFVLDVTVKEPVTYDTEISMSVGNVTMTITDDTNLPKITRKITNFDKLQGPVTVKSSAASVASAEIDNAGIITVTGLKEGKVAISVESPGIPTATFEVTVFEDISDKEIELSEASPIKIYMDDSTKKTVFLSNYTALKGKVEGTIEDSKIATLDMMDNAFTVKALKEGKTTITLSCEGAEDKVVRVYVYEGSSGKDEDKDDDDNDDDVTEITKITINDDNFSLVVGKSKTLDVALRPKNVSTTYLRYTSDDKDIATVSTSGKVTAVKEGTTYINAYYRKDDDISDRVKVTVTKSATSDKESTDKESDKDTTTGTSNSKLTLVDRIPYVLPVGTYNLPKMLGISEDRVKPVTLTVNANSNETNVMIDGKLYPLQVSGLQLSGQTTGYTDVPTTHWANRFVSYASTKGYLAGTGSNQYQPTVKLSYGDTFIALSRVFANNGITSTVSKRDTIDDYMQDFEAGKLAYYPYKYIMSLLNDKEVARYTQPGNAMYTAGISRIHMANILYNLTSNMKLPQTSKTFSFPDVQTTDMLNYVGNTGLMIGQADGNFNPNGQLSRAELATIIARLDVLISNKGTSSSTSTGSNSSSNSNTVNDTTESNTVDWG